MPLDEMALRKDGFRAGVCLTLADGQGWHLPRPEAAWTFDDSEAGAKLAFDLGPEFDALSAAAESAETVGEVARAVMKSAAFLLRLNYDLTPADLATLLRAKFAPVAEGQAETDAHVLGRELWAISQGATPAPRSFPDGSASA